jgi:hypothetical protein
MENNNYKLITLISVLFVTVLIISNIVSTKILDLWFFTFDGWTILFPLSYIIWDILTEVYWYKQSRKIIWMWFWCIILVWITIMIVWLLPPSADWPYQEDYQNILWLTPRIIIASLIAYFAWEFSNSYILAKLKIYTKWKKLWLRIIGSTVVWEFFDTMIFILVAFYWIFWNDVIIAIIISNYIFKVWVEILFTPLTYKIIWKIKKIENEDYYDYETDFNPIKF